MTAMLFVDTNVLVYAASNALEDRVKRHTARALLARPDIALSAQVLQEFYAMRACVLVLLCFMLGCSGRPSSSGSAAAPGAATPASPRRQLHIMPAPRPGVFQLVIAGGASDGAPIAEAGRDRQAARDLAALVKDKVAAACTAARAKLVPAECSDKDFETLRQQLSDAAAQASTKRRIVDRGVERVGPAYYVAYLIAEIDHKDLLSAMTGPAEKAAAVHGWDKDRLVTGLRTAVLPALQVGVGGYYKNEVAQSKATDGKAIPAVP